MKPPNKLSTKAVTTYCGFNNTIYDPTIDIETVDIADAHNVYILFSGNNPSCFLTEINTSDCPKIADATALYDSSFPIPFTLLNARPIDFTIIGNTLICCKIPIKADINTIGINTLKKNENSF
ncbi:hypothetical protein BMB171_C1681 [Bacillus thuringiensis BMB171]|nr:hypothetical protein BMB171_C1681 [Bacillus thuringiensis BMB171]COT20950.1 Uncharacterised protein [Streptococcus pneumoniae]